MGNRLVMDTRTAPESLHGRSSLAPALTAVSPTPADVRILRRLALILVLVGIVVRVTRYFMLFPLWGDEIFICQNFIDRDYLGLTRQLDGGQIAPVFFLWAQMAVFRAFGGAELAMRALPLFAGIVSLGLFWSLARRLVSPVAAVLAVGLLSVATWPVSMSHFAKPYGFDLLTSSALLLAAVRWLHHPERLSRLALLTVLVPMALLGSYPAVFVAGGVSLALLPTAWRQPGLRVKLLFVTFNVAMIVAFLASLQVGKEQLDGTAVKVHDFLMDYWAHGFPPASLAGLPLWLLSAHTGRMFAYPVGDGHGGSTLTFLLFLIGGWQLCRAGKWQLLMLLLTPFALNLLAAGLHRYPYGGCCRLAQHLAPAICLLAGNGAGALIEQFAPSQTARMRWAWGLCGLFTLVGVIHIVSGAWRPYHDPEALWSRRLVAELFHQAGPNDQVIVLNEPDEVCPVMRYRLKLRGDRVSWGGRIDRERLASGTRLWCLDDWPEGGDVPNLVRVAPHLDEIRKDWRVVRHFPFTMRAPPGDDVTYHCDVYFCSQGDVPAPRMFSCWP